MAIDSLKPYELYPGPILILAGPGTGKTYQLAKRIKYLTEVKKITPNHITVITFTNEAANSMKSKIEEEGRAEFITPNNRPKRISTMHSLGLSIINENLRACRLKKDFKLITSPILKEALMIDSALLCGFNFQDAKNTEKQRICGQLNYLENSKTINDQYEYLLRKCNTIDYEDQIILACFLLNKDKKIKLKYSEQSKYLLIDEYQDINESQFQFINLLSQDNLAGLFVVGDDDQSVYGFRGGEPKFIRQFKKHYKHASIIPMKVSRRCLKNILESAMTIVKKFDKDRYQKPNFDYISKNPGEVCIHDCPSDKSEAHLIASIIMNDISSHKGKKRNAFVLIPTTKYAKEIQTSLRKFRLNYDFRKGRDFSNWNNLFLLENWVKNPNDNLLTREIIQLIIESGSSKIPTNKSKSESRIQERQKYLNEIAKIWTTTFQKNTSFWLELKKQKSNLVLKEIIDMMENLIIKSSGNKLSEYLKLISESIRPWTSKFIFFEELENLLKFSTNQSHLKTKYNIRILSMQAAKGLEAELIFVVGLEEKSIPFCTSDDKNISEKARTLFVAMTRAKEQLHLLHCRNRAGSSTFHQDSRQLQVSHFLDVLPKEFIKKIYHQSQ